MDLKQALKALHVQRWHIVHTTKYQSIAEHMYGVWLISMAIYDAMFPVPHNSIERAEVAYLALTHDLPEVVLGDIPSSAKETNPSFVKTMREAEITVRIGMGLPVVTDGLPHYIVHLADYAEAAYFAQHYITDPHVKVNVFNRLNEYLQECKKAHPHHDWVAAHHKVFGPLLSGI